MSFRDFEDLRVKPAERAARAKTRTQAIEATKDLISSEPNLTNRGELLLRLAHLYHQRGRDGEPEALAHAVLLYRTILDSYAAFPLEDHTLFFLGFALLSQGENQDAEVFLARVLREHPNSTYVPHTYLHLGEAAFSAQDWTSARNSYGKAIQHPSFEFAAFTMYKIAWCWQRLGDRDAAITAMEAVILQQEEAPMAVASYQVLAYWYAQQGMPPDPDVVLKMAALRGSDADMGSAREPAGCLHSMKAQRALIQRAPMSPQAPERQLAIVLCFVKLKRLGDAASETARMVDTYGPRSRWSELQDRPTRKSAKILIKTARDASRGAARSR